MITYNDYFYGRNDHERWARMTAETARALRTVFDNEPWWEMQPRVDAIPRCSFVDYVGGPPQIHVRAVQEDTAQSLTRQLNEFRHSHGVVSDRMDDMRHLYL